MELKTGVQLGPMSVYQTADASLTSHLDSCFFYKLTMPYSCPMNESVSEFNYV